MAKSLSLALYLATRARRDRAAKRDAADGTDSQILEAERQGHPTEVRPKGPLIWFHTGTDRHGLSARELVTRMQIEREDVTYLMTTSDPRRKPATDGVLSQSAPDDIQPSVRKFLDAWTPDVAIWTEADLRPVLITQTAERGIPMYLIDARTARPDVQAWRWLPGMSGSLLTRFERILAGDQDSADALRRLGAPAANIEVTGYLEEGTPALSCNEKERDAIAATLAARPVWLAAHATAPEIEPILKAHVMAQRRSHRLLLIIVPDQVEDGPTLAADLIAQGHTVALRSNGEEPEPQTQIYIADSEGEMGLWFRLAPISFLGRSLSPDGGANPYEAAALGSAVIHGPHVSNYRRAYAKLGDASACIKVNDGEELSEAVDALLSPDVAARLAHEAWTVCSSGAEVTDRVRDMIFTALEEREAM